MREEGEGGRGRMREEGEEGGGRMRERVMKQEERGQYKKWKTQPTMWTCVGCERLHLSYLLHLPTEMANF